ncbi:MAG: 50S ribosomal protein L6 [Candidatus Heimdallarchaeum aukensis]|uniref:50S ribosomal protein L6 n=1 Tax=Candidatus Heimdallarchaeum aukensis TaxID=2876573 RepID=A0A9Y1FKB9_9ARCH|nr:MAG: 50S ribosomal protein L6 [Candidatus Heimdallarchaeum aukensis]
MTKTVVIEREIEIPEDVKVTLDGKIITVEGPKGKLTKDFSRFDETYISLEGSKMKFSAYNLNRRKKAKILSAVGLFSNMIEGTRKGYTYKSKIVFSHFPITVEPDNKKREVIIKNLYGGRKLLKAKIVGDDTKVTVDKEDVITTGIDKEAVGQTVANMQEICRLRGKRKKDPEVFMDGVWVYEKE